MLNSRTWRFLIVLSCAIARFANPADARETEPRQLVVFVVKSPARSTAAAISVLESAGVLHEEQASAEPFGLSRYTSPTETCASLDREDRRDVFIGRLLSGQFILKVRGFVTHMA
jgi:hypothetical protein